MPKNHSNRQFCKIVALLLREARERQGLSRSAVAKRAGLSYQMIARMERNQYIHKMVNFFRIAHALELKPVKILAQAEKLSG